MLSACYINKQAENEVNNRVAR